MHSVLEKYLPTHAVPMVDALLQQHLVYLRIVPARNSKHGDYRKLPNGQHQITVNGSLNQYRFLITLIHEIAHLVAIEKFGRDIASHGKEWKFTFQRLMLPFIRPEIFPEQILPLLARHFKNPTASSDTDVHLAKALKQLDESYENTTFIHQIPNGSIFKIYNGRTFQKVGLKVKRYVCKELSTGKAYLFNANAEVEWIKS